MSGPSPETDIVTLLAHDHDVLRHLVSGLQGLAPGELEKRFSDLRVNLVRHEMAEQRVVYPAIRTDVVAGPDVADELVKEESETEQLLSGLDQTPRDDGTFARVLDIAQSRILEHMRDEERNLFPLLRDLEADVRRWELGSHYLRAVRASPTHPHPHLPGGRSGTLATGWLAGVVDRLRDSLSRSR